MESWPNDPGCGFQGNVGMPWSTVYTETGHFDCWHLIHLKFSPTYRLKHLETFGNLIHN